MRGLGIALLALVASTPAAAQDGLQEVLDCVRKNAPKTALEQSVELVSADRDGRELSRTAKLFAKRSGDGFGRILLRVEEPADLRGTTFLLTQRRDGTDLYVYLPELGKVRRVTARQVRGKLLGSDFSYEELERLFGQTSQRGVARLPDAEREGRPVYALEATPAEGSAYAKITTFVDRKTCVPLEIAFYGKEGAPQKLLTVDPARITREGDVYVSRLVRIRDLAKQTESRMVTHAVRIDPDLSDSMFNPTGLELRK